MNSTMAPAQQAVLQELLNRSVAHIRQQGTPSARPVGPYKDRVQCMYHHPDGLRWGIIYLSPLTSGEGVNYHSHMDIIAAARQATANGRSKVLVQALYESKPTHRCLKWDGERPYVVIGTRQARHREYLNGFRSLYDGTLFIFTSSMQ